MSKTKQFHQENVVILCEGTKTEFQYFNSIKEYLKEKGINHFSEIKVVPVENEMVTPTGQRRKKQLKASTDGLDTSICYYCLQEESRGLYDQYKAYPTRFVRETHLYMERFKFKYGWAVYDHDNHPERKEALQYAKSWGVKIAFSSRCFEEWLLMHFERSDRVFKTSECKDHNDKEIRCGTGIGSSDCHGLNCVGGRLRECNYISDYNKTKVSGIFKQYTLPLWETCLINSAWLNKIEIETPVYDRTRYTDVGVLVAFLLGIEERAEWMSLGDSISYRSTKIEFHDKGGYIEVENKGNVSCILNSLSYRDNACKQICSAIERTWLEPQKTAPLLLKPGNAAMICLKDGSRIVAIGL